MSDTSIQPTSHDLEEQRRQDRETCEKYMYLATQEQRDEFLAKSTEEKAEICYSIWITNGQRSHALLPQSKEIPCSSEENSDLFINGASDSLLESAEEDGGDGIKRARRQYKRNIVAAKSVCAQCPLVAACLSSSVTLSSEVDDQISYEPDCVWGATDKKERAEIYNSLLELWTEDFKYGYVNLRTVNRFDVFEHELREEFGDEEVEKFIATMR